MCIYIYLNKDFFLHSTEYHKEPAYAVLDIHHWSLPFHSYWLRAGGHSQDFGMQTALNVDQTKSAAAEKMGLEV